MAETHSFQAEVKQVLDIVVHSLYTDSEIFVRELVSNASDALEKLRHTRITEKEVLDENLGLEINLTTDDTAKTFTIQDFGIGMTHDELVENLGTIAHSGSKAFLEALKATGGANENLIGQFGVGFYSVFMVADKVEVYTRAWQPGSQGWKWVSDGSGTYTIEECEGLRRGTKIIAHLKENYKEFSQKWRVQGILERYSGFLEFPVNLNGEKVDTREAIWLKDKAGVSEEEYKEFYKFQAKAMDEPFDWMHFSADAPLDIHALVFIPGRNPEIPGMGRLDPGVALHCRKVLIDPEPKNFLPEWLRFLKGVVDSADLPLNISRESMQDSRLAQKIGGVLVKRFCRHLESLAKKDEARFAEFYKQFSVYLKEGAATDFTYRDQLTPLLRWESSALAAGETTSFQGYVDRMRENQKEIYFLVGPNRAALESGPYLEAFKARGLEVLFCYEPIDDFVMSNLGNFAEKRLVSGDSDNLELPEPESAPAGEPLSEGDAKALCAWFKDTLGEAKVKEVSTGKRLFESPVAALNADTMMTPAMRRLMQAMGQEDAPEPAVKLEINPRHDLIKSLNAKRDSDPDTARLIAQQLHDNALISAGLLDDPRPMVSRLNALLAKIGV
ncbi:MAG: molecular chaperone HtpG [Opitutales bacterium]